MIGFWILRPGRWKLPCQKRGTGVVIDRAAAALRCFGAFDCNARLIVVSGPSGGNGR